LLKLEFVIFSSTGTLISFEVLYISQTNAITTQKGTPYNTAKAVIIKGIIDTDMLLYFLPFRVKVITV